jgi:hypothetical protein
MSNIVAQAGVVSIIPEFMIEQAIAHLSVGGDVIRKLNDGTEGQKFAVFSRPQDLLEDYGGLFLRREVLLQPFIEGEEYSVVAAVGPWGTQVYEPVFKQSSSTSGVHPCKRVRAVPRAPGEEAIATRLVAIVEELCGRFPQANGLLEFEFIRNREELFFLELNPRLAATTRIVAMASTRNPFCEVAGLRRRLGHEAVRVPTRKYAVELVTYQFRPESPWPMSLAKERPQGLIKSTRYLPRHMQQKKRRQRLKQFESLFRCFWIKILIIQAMTIRLCSSCTPQKGLKSRPAPLWQATHGWKRPTSILRRPFAPCARTTFRSTRGRFIPLS